MKHFTLVAIISAVVLLGAACGKNTGTNSNVNTGGVTNTVSNTNLALNTNSVTTTNTSVTNSAATNLNSAVVTNTNTSATATVTITSSGVSPKTLTVSSGTRVTFVNNDSSAHQIASNPHPSHSDLPEFDRSVAAGGTYSFTFTRTGSWGYHDHDDPFNSALKGTIIVQ